METKKWNVGQIIWFAFYILCQWLMCIEYATKPATAWTPEYQQMAVAFGVAAAIATALLLWLAIGHSKKALYVNLIIAGIGAVVNIILSGFGVGLLSLLLPGLNWLIVRNRVQ